MAGKHGIDMLLAQYHESPNLKKYIQIIVDEFAEVRQAMSDSLKYRYLADSFGVMVDDIAYLIGASRVIYGAAALGYFGFFDNPGAFPAGDDNRQRYGGVFRSDSDRESGDFIRTDSQLKNAIHARIIKITGSCTVEQLITYVELILGRDIDLEIVEGDKNIQFKIHEELEVQEKVILSYMIPDFKPVGKTATLKDSAGNIALVRNSEVYPPET